MSVQGSIIVLSSSELEGKLEDFASSPSSPVPRNPTMYYTNLLKRDLTAEETKDGATVKDFFELNGPPPTEMTLRVDTKFLELSVDSFNNDIQVFLSSYILDCVWRDSDNPADRLTANAGTSRSRRIKVFLYAGNPSGRESIRLLKSSIYLDSNALDPDFYVHRNQAHIYEKAHNPYHPNLNLSSDLYFENQYTQQTERFEDPGLYLGVMHPQAIMTLRTSREITIRWETDRAPEHPSPFWYTKFLTGASLWNHETLEFEVQEPGVYNNVSFQNVETVSVQTAGGPYFPLTLYTLSLPINPSVAPFINDSKFEGSVKDPLDGEVCPLNHAEVTLQLGQMAIRGTTDLAQVNTRNMPVLAPSDENSFEVPVFDATTGDTDILLVHQRVSTQVPSRYAVDGKSSIEFPNGAWKGEPLQSGNTAMMSDWKS